VVGVNISRGSQSLPYAALDDELMPGVALNTTVYGHDSRTTGGYWGVDLCTCDRVRSRLSQRSLSDDVRKSERSTQSNALAWRGAQKKGCDAITVISCSELRHGGTLVLSKCAARESSCVFASEVGTRVRAIV